MPIPAVLSYAAAYLSLILTAAVLLRDRHSFVHRVFAAGMFLFAIEEIFRALSYNAVLPDDVLYWNRRIITTSALVPVAWLLFSVSYARAESRGLFSRWKLGLLGIGLAPIPLVLIFRHSIFKVAELNGPDQWLLSLDSPGWYLQFYLLIVSVLILFNLERTIRSSTGRVRWQIKFMALGVGVLFGLRLYLASQALLYSGIDTKFGATNAAALLVANILFAFSLARGRTLNVDVYLSTATIQNSFTIILAGIYLLTVGVLARVAQSISPELSLPLGAFIVFVSLTALAVLLLSNRMSRKLRLFVTSHFKRPAYDYRRVWMDLTKRTTSLVGAAELSTAVCRMLSDSLEILSVNVWLVDESQRRLTLAGSTSIPQTLSKSLERAGTSAPELIRYLRENPDTLDLDEKSFAWASEIENAAADSFRGARIRYAIGLHAAGDLVGVMTLNDDRVGRGGEGTLSTEDTILVQTLASQLAASLLNLKLSARLRNAKEMEAFQAVSTFFVHDLKNLASRLSLTMQNLPSNFDNPEFRADALRVIGNSLNSIDAMCARLSMLKQNIELRLAESDLCELVNATLDEFKVNLRGELERDLHPVPKTAMDSEQIHKVLTNLVMNANEALNGNGVIRVGTLHEGDTVSVSVRDNGCGMSEEFIENSLFRPFQTTKKKGLGIGLFHCKMIVEAHRGKIEVNSIVGKGTEFRVILPVS